MNTKHGHHPCADNGSGRCSHVRPLRHQQQLTHEASAVKPWHRQMQPPHLTHTHVLYTRTIANPHASAETASTPPKRLSHRTHCTPSIGTQNRMNPFLAAAHHQHTHQECRPAIAAWTGAVWHSLVWRWWWLQPLHGTQIVWQSVSVRLVIQGTRCGACAAAAAAACTATGGCYHCSCSAGNRRARQSQNRKHTHTPGASSIQATITHAAVQLLRLWSQMVAAGSPLQQASTNAASATLYKTNKSSAMLGCMFFGFFQSWWLKPYKTLLRQGAHNKHTSHTSHTHTHVSASRQQMGACCRLKQVVVLLQVSSNHFIPSQQQLHGVCRNLATLAGQSSKSRGRQKCNTLRQ